MLDLKGKWHGAPVWLWMVGGTATGAAGLILYRRHKAAMAGSSTPTSSGPTSIDPNSPGPSTGGGAGGGNNGDSALQGLLTSLQSTFQGFQTAQQASTKSFLDALSANQRAQQTQEQSFLASLAKSFQSNGATDQPAATPVRAALPAPASAPPPPPPPAATYNGVPISPGQRLADQGFQKAPDSWYVPGSPATQPPGSSGFPGESSVPPGWYDSILKPISW